MSIYQMTQTKEGREAFSKALSEATAKQIAELRRQREAENDKPPARPFNNRFANSNFGNGF